MRTGPRRKGDYSRTRGVCRPKAADAPAIFNLKTISRLSSARVIRRISQSPYPYSIIIPQNDALGNWRP
jgi:hypothetical protein